MPTPGFAGVHDDPFIVICTVAPVLLTVVVAKVTPAVESWKLWPPTSDISHHCRYVGVAGVMSISSLLLPLPSVPRWKSTPVVTVWIYGKLFVRNASKPMGWRASR